MSDERSGAGEKQEEPSDEQAGPTADLAGELRALRRRTRTDRHAYWFPLVLFGLITCGAIPFYLQGTPAGRGAPSGPALPMLGGFLAHRHLGYYWLVALLAGVLLTLLWYRRNARRVGLQTPALGYLVTVAVLTGLALAIPLLSQVRSPHSLRWLHHLQLLWPGDLVIRGTFPFVIIAVGLWALAWAERSRALAVIAAAYTGAALLASLYDVENVLFRIGWNPGPGQYDLTTLPNVLLPALVLLAAGAGAFAVQRRHRTAT
jgi:hypothetical protein